MSREGEREGGVFGGFGWLVLSLLWLSERRGTRLLPLPP